MPRSPWRSGSSVCGVRSGSIVHNVSAILLTVFAGVATLFGLFFLDNPSIWHIVINGEFINEFCSATRRRPFSRCCCPTPWRAGGHAAYGNTLAAGALVLALSYSFP